MPGVRRDLFLTYENPISSTLVAVPTLSGKERSKSEKLELGDQNSTTKCSRARHQRGGHRGRLAGAFLVPARRLGSDWVVVDFLRNFEALLKEVLMASDHRELLIASRTVNSDLGLGYTISTNYIDRVQRRSGHRSCP